MASQRVMKHMTGERERKRAEGMLRVCGELIDLDISILSLKILKHVSTHSHIHTCNVLAIQNDVMYIYMYMAHENVNTQGITPSMLTEPIPGRVECPFCQGRSTILS